MRSILAWIYGLVVSVRNNLFEMGILRSVKLPGRVISVGNIAVGGTGKSPVVIAIAKQLLSQGFRCAVLTRGYKGGLKGSEWMAILDAVRVAGDANAVAKPDEAFMQSQSLTHVPVVVGSNRVRAAKEWVRFCRVQGRSLPDVWILDDGFQHRRIQRDLNIVLLDAKKPFGALLPKGTFREQTESLARADIGLFTRADSKHPKPGDLAFPSVMNPKMIIETVAFNVGMPVKVYGENGTPEPKAYVLCAGIAHPKQLEDSVEALKLTVIGKHFVDDHEPILTDALKPLLTPGAGVLTTAKDWARSDVQLKTLGVAVFILPLELTLPDSVQSLILKTVQSN